MKKMEPLFYLLSQDRASSRLRLSFRPPLPDEEEDTGSGRFLPLVSLMSLIMQLLFLAAMIFLFIFYNNYYILLLVIVLALLIFLSAFTLRTLSGRITYRFTASPALVEKDTPITLSFSTDYASLIPLMNYEVTIHVMHSLYGHEDEYRIFQSLTKGDNEVILSIRPRHCGAYRFVIVRGMVTDLFHVNHIRVSATASHTMYVLPEKPDLPVDVSSVGGVGMTELSDQEVPGHDASQVIDVREYRPGDKLSSIHWKLSARMNDIIVKQYGSLSSEDVYILVDLCRFYDYDVRLTSAKADLACDPYRYPADAAFAKKAGILSSPNPSLDILSDRLADQLDQEFALLDLVCTRLLSQKRPFTLGYPKGQSLAQSDLDDLAEITVHTKGEYQEALLSLFYAAPSAKYGNTLSLYQTVGTPLSRFLFVTCKTDGQAPKGQVLAETPLAALILITGE